MRNIYCVMYEVRKVAEVKGKAEGFENNQRRSLRSGQYKGAPQEPRVVGPEVTGHIIWGQQPHHRHLRGMSTWTSQLWQPGKNTMWVRGNHLGLVSFVGEAT